MAQNPYMPAEVAYEDIFLLHFEELLHVLVILHNAIKVFAIAKCRIKFFLDLMQTVRNH